MTADNKKLSLGGPFFMGEPVSKRVLEEVEKVGSVLHPDMIKGLTEFTVDNRDAQEIVKLYSDREEDKIMTEVVNDSLDITE